MPLPAMLQQQNHHLIPYANSRLGCTKWLKYTSLSLHNSVTKTHEVKNNMAGMDVEKLSKVSDSVVLLFE